MLDLPQGQDGLGSRSWSTTAECGPEIEEARVREGAHCRRRGGEPRLQVAGSNLGARGGGSVLVFLNLDTVVAPGAIAQLARTLGDPSIAIAMARLRLLDEPEKLKRLGRRRPRDRDRLGGLLRRARGLGA